MAHSSDDSIDEFYDAVDEISTIPTSTTISTTSTKNDFESSDDDDEIEKNFDERQPRWAAFSRPKILQIIPPAIPPPPSTSRNGKLPAPPSSGLATPRSRPPRNQFVVAAKTTISSTPPREIVERKISAGSSTGSTSTARIEIFQKIGSGIVGGSSTTSNEDTPSRRRRKLDDLRTKLRSFEIGDEDGGNRGGGKKLDDGIGGGGDKPSDTSSTSDLSSLASWSKNFLNSSHNIGSSEEKTIVCDEPSTSSTTASTTMAMDSIETPRAINIESSTLLKSPPPRPPPPTSSNQDPNDSVFTVATSTDSSTSQKPTAVTSSSSSSSSATSSKSSTLEKSTTQLFSSTASPVSFASNHSSSLHRRPSSARSSKSNSLTKDVASISACEHFLYSNNDSDNLAILARKNSEAAEVIEALTSELVRKAESDHREQLRRSSTSIGGGGAGVNGGGTDATDGQHQIEADNQIATASTVADTSAHSDSAAASSVKRTATEAPGRRSLRSVGGTIREPDIVASNRVKAGEDAVAAPLINKPPRTRRSADVRTTTTPSISPVPEGGVRSFSVDPSATPAIVDPADLSTDIIDKTLSTVMIKNLDTGEKVPLIAFDDKSSQYINPLARHIMELTADGAGAGSDCADTDSESMVSSEDVGSLRGAAGKHRYLSNAKQTTSRMGKALGKRVGKAMQKTVGAMNKVKEGVAQHWHKEESSQSDEEENSESSKIIRVRASHHHKGPYHFDQIKLAQDMSGEHTGAVWSMKFSHCGRVLATAGQDKDIRVWVLKESFNYFNNMRLKYSVADTEKFNNAFMSPASDDSTPCHTLSHGTSMSSVYASQLGDELPKTKSTLDLAADSISLCSAITTNSTASTHQSQSDDALAPFVQKPFCVFKGHSADVLDLCWSKNFFLLSSSMDRTVRLWHISRKECLCCFQHAEFVTAIAFLPKDDRYFLSASLDGKLRVWHIPEKKVALWNEVEGGKLITALTFAKSGKFVVVGTSDGRCVFYTTEQLKYHTQIDVKSSHGKNSRGHKVTGLESYQDKLLVTSSDSRIRLYDTRDLSLTCKYKGYYNYGSQIRASFSHDGKYIVCGSEDKNVYLWKTVVDTDMLSTLVRKDRNRRWESIRAHDAVVTAAVFAPKPDLIFQQIEERKRKISNIEQPSSSNVVNNDVRLPGVVRSMPAMAGEVLVTADFGGAIYVFFNKPKVKLGSSVFLPSY